MMAYIGIAPVAGALVRLVLRRAFWTVLDVLRAAVALALPFVTEIRQVYVLFFVLRAGSAAFTPAFQATTPDILPEGVEYTKDLFLSRPAYNLEALASLVIAVALLGLVGFHWLFAGNALGFPASAALVLTVVLSPPKPPTTQVGPGAALRAVRAFTLPRHGCAGC